MQSKTVINRTSLDKWSFLWLVIGVLLLILSTGIFSVGLAAWLAPIFLIRFFRTRRTGIGYLFILLGLFIAYAVSWRSIISFAMFESLPVFLVLAFIIALQNTLPYLADRLITPHLKGFLGTLVFPAAVTAMFYLNSLANPLGSFGTTGYEQYSNTALIQMVSVTGLWGLTFLVSWVGPIFNWVWEQAFNWPVVRRGVLVFSVIVMAVFLYGGVRLSMANFEPGTVRVHGFSLPNAVSAEYQKTGSVNVINDAYISGTVREAKAGAELVLWGEMAAGGTNEEAAGVISRAQQVASDNKIYLVIGLQGVYPDEDRPVDNRVVIIDPTGQVVLNHLKYGAVLISNNTPGDGILQTVATPFGKLSAVICWDADFPNVMRQLSLLGVDIVLVPTGDTPEVARLHAHQAIFRAVENGISLIRQDSAAGLSIASDPYGRVIAAMDKPTANQRVLVAQVPTKHVFTVYSRIGDLFAWLACAGFLALMTIAIVIRRKSRSQG